MARTLKVYVSCALDELAEEKLAVKHALQSLPLSVQWEFDFTSTTSGRVSDEYLERVWDCDFYILMIGQRQSDPVAREYETASQAEKSIVTLVMDIPREPEAKQFLKGLKVKPRPRYFETMEEFNYQVQAGVSDELIKQYKRLRLDEKEMKELARQRIEHIAKERQQSRDWRASVFMMVVLLLIVGVAVIVGRGKNAPPVIERMAAIPTQVTVGKTADVQVWARDPEGGGLTFRWQASAGFIDSKASSDSPLATFRAPDKPGAVTIQVTVSDMLGLETEEKTDITVIDESSK